LQFDFLFSVKHFCETLWCFTWNNFCVKKLTLFFTFSGKYMACACACAYAFPHFSNDFFYLFSHFSNDFLHFFHIFPTTFPLLFHFFSTFVNKKRHFCAFSDFNWITFWLLKNIFKDLFSF
jgi:hypothetical protein